MTRKYYILNPDEGINSLCTSFLDETAFAQLLTVVESDGSKKACFGWEVTLKQLREIYQSAKDKTIPLKRFRVAVSRTRSKESLRIAQKEEYIEGYQSQNKRPERLKQILSEKKEKLRGVIRD